MWYCNGAAGSPGTLGLGGNDATGCGGLGGGGGGGSSFVESTGFNVHETKGGAAFGNDQVVIAWP